MRRVVGYHIGMFRTGLSQRRIIGNEGQHLLRPCRLANVDPLGVFLPNSAATRSTRSIVRDPRSCHFLRVAGTARAAERGGLNVSLALDHVQPTTHPRLAARPIRTGASSAFATTNGLSDGRMTDRRLAQRVSTPSLERERGYPRGTARTPLLPPARHRARSAGADCGAPEPPASPDRSTPSSSKASRKRPGSGPRTPNLDPASPRSIAWRRLSPTFIENSSYQTSMCCSRSASASGRTSRSLSSLAWQMNTSCCMAFISSERSSATQA